MSGLRVIDTFCGGGGFSEGFRQAGFHTVLGIDNWAPARATYEANGLGDTIDLDMLELIGDGGYARARTLAREMEERYGRVDVLIGSPPCTEFSYAKKGGKGDIEKGMLLVRAHLVLAAALRPTFWLMENVPRLQHALRDESEPCEGGGHAIPLSRLGVEGRISGIPWIRKGYLHIPYGEVHVASDYGAPQRRARFLAGNVAPNLIEPADGGERTFEGCLWSLEESLKSTSVRDPNYPHHRVARSRVRDHFYDTSLHPMYWEEMRHLKRRHIHYGRMAFPDELDRPGRTIMATFNPSSREAVLIDTGRWTVYQGKRRPVYRQPTVREVACLQGFPLDFQLVAGSLSGRYKLVGNAVPCQMSYALARAVLRAFEQSGFEDAEQKSRFRKTMEHVESSRQRGKRVPLIGRQKGDCGEAPDFGTGSLRSFGSRPHKHIRRKLLSSKPFQSSSVIVFENTDWTAGGKRIGGSWKACIQKGTGTRFSQVYLDAVSVASLLDALNPAKHAGGRAGGSQLEFEEIRDGGTEARLDTASIVAGITRDIDEGIPLVGPGWVEFPGYEVDPPEQYLRLVSSKRLPLPSSSLLQELFTTHRTDTGGPIGPIDLFDGLDAIMLGHMVRPEARWVLRDAVRLTGLTDQGARLYHDRISRYAVGRIDGELPLVTIIAALAAVHALGRMHADVDAPGDAYVGSLKTGWAELHAWLRTAAHTASATSMVPLAPART